MEPSDDAPVTVPARVVEIRDKSGIVCFLARGQEHKARFQRLDTRRNGSLVSQTEPLGESIETGADATITRLEVLKTVGEVAQGIFFTAVIEINDYEAESLKLFKNCNIGLVRFEEKLLLFQIKRLLVNNFEAPFVFSQLSAILSVGQKITLLNKNAIETGDHLDLVSVCVEIRKHSDPIGVTFRCLPIDNHFYFIGNNARTLKIRYGVEFRDRELVVDLEDGSHVPPLNSDVLIPENTCREGFIVSLSGSETEVNKIRFPYRGRDIVVGFYTSYLSVNGNRVTRDELATFKPLLKIGMPVNIMHMKQYANFTDYSIKFLAVVNVNGLSMLPSDVTLQSSFKAHPNNSVISSNGSNTSNKSRSPTPNSSHVSNKPHSVRPSVAVLDGSKVSGVIESLSTTCRTGVASINVDSLSSRVQNGISNGDYVKFLYSHFVLKNVTIDEKTVSIHEYKSYVSVGSEVSLSVKKTKNDTAIQYESEGEIFMKREDRKLKAQKEKEEREESLEKFPNDKIFDGIVGETIHNEGVRQPRVVTVVMNKRKESVFIPLRNIRLDGNKLVRHDFLKGRCHVGMNVKLSHLKPYNKTFKYEGKVEFYSSDFCATPNTSIDSIRSKDSSILESSACSESDVEEELPENEPREIDPNKKKWYELSSDASKVDETESADDKSTKVGGRLNGFVVELIENRNGFQPRVVETLIDGNEERVFVHKKNVKIDGISVEKSSYVIDFKIGLQVKLNSVEEFGQYDCPYLGAILLDKVEGNMYSTLADLEVSAQNDIISWAYNEDSSDKIELKNELKSSNREEEKANLLKRLSQKVNVGKNAIGELINDLCRNPIKNIPDSLDKNNKTALEHDTTKMENKTVNVDAMEKSVQGIIVNVANKTGSTSEFNLVKFRHKSREELGVFYKNRVAYDGRKLSNKENLWDLLETGMTVKVCKVEKYEKNGVRHLVGIEARGKDAKKRRQDKAAGISIDVSYSLRDEWTVDAVADNDPSDDELSENETIDETESRKKRKRLRRKLAEEKILSKIDLEVNDADEENLLTGDIEGIIHAPVYRDFDNKYVSAVSIKYQGKDEIALFFKNRITIDGGKVSGREVIWTTLKPGMSVTVTKLAQYSGINRSRYNYLAEVDVKRTNIVGLLADVATGAGIGQEPGCGAAEREADESGEEAEEGSDSYGSQYSELEENEQEDLSIVDLQSMIKPTLEDFRNISEGSAFESMLDKFIQFIGQKSAVVDKAEDSVRDNIDVVDETIKVGEEEEIVMSKDVGLTEKKEETKRNEIVHDRNRDVLSKNEADNKDVPVIAENDNVVLKKKDVIEENNGVVSKNEDISKKGNVVVSENKNSVVKNEPVIKKNEVVIENKGVVAKNKPPVKTVEIDAKNKGEIVKNEPVVKKNEVVFENKGVVMKNKPLVKTVEIDAKNKGEVVKNEPVIKKNEVVFENKGVVAKNKPPVKKAEIDAKNKREIVNNEPVIKKNEVVFENKGVVANNKPLVKKDKIDSHKGEIVKNEPVIKKNEVVFENKGVVAKNKPLVKTVEIDAKNKGEVVNNEPVIKKKDVEFVIKKDKAVFEKNNDITIENQNFIKSLDEIFVEQIKNSPEYFVNIERLEKSLKKLAVDESVGKSPKKTTNLMSASDYIVNVNESKTTSSLEETRKVVHTSNKTVTVQSGLNKDVEDAPVTAKPIDKSSTPTNEGVPPSVEQFVMDVFNDLDDLRCRVDKNNEEDVSIHGGSVVGLDKPLRAASKEKIPSEVDVEVPLAVVVGNDTSGSVRDNQFNEKTINEHRSASSDATATTVDQTSVMQALLDRIAALESRLDTVTQGSRPAGAGERGGGDGDRVTGPACGGESPRSETSAATAPHPIPATIHDASTIKPTDMASRTSAIRDLIMTRLDADVDHDVAFQRVAEEVGAICQTEAEDAMARATGEKSVAATSGKKTCDQGSQTVITGHIMTFKYYTGE